MGKESSARVNYLLSALTFRYLWFRGRDSLLVFDMARGRGVDKIR